MKKKFISKILTLCIILTNCISIILPAEAAGEYLLYYNPSVNAGEPGYISTPLQDYGITYNWRENWAPAIQEFGKNNINTDIEYLKGKKGVMFSPRKENDNVLHQTGSWDFRNDKKNNPVAFNDVENGYVFEQEIASYIRPNQYMDAKWQYRIMGLDKNGAKVMVSGIETVIPYVNGKFPNPQNGHVYGIAKAVDTANGNEVPYPAKDAVKTNTTNQISFLRTYIDMKNQTYTSWIVTRADLNTPYSEKEPEKADLIIKDEPFKNNIKQIVGMDVYSFNTYADQTHITKMGIKSLDDQTVINEANKAFDINDILGENESAQKISKPLNLPDFYQNASVNWEISPSGILGNNGEILVVPDTDTEVTLNATLKRGVIESKKTFNVTVASMQSDADKVLADKEALDLGNLKAVTSDIPLPLKGSKNNSVILWTSDNDNVISINNDKAVVKRGEKNQKVNITAHLTYNAEKLTKSFEVIVKGTMVSYNPSAKEGEDGYMPSNTVGDYGISTPATSWSSKIQTFGYNNIFTDVQGLHGKKGVMYSPRKQNDVSLRYTGAWYFSNDKINKYPAQKNPEGYIFEQEFASYLRPNLNGEAIWQYRLMGLDQDGKRMIVTSLDTSVVKENGKLPAPVNGNVYGSAKLSNTQNSKIVPFVIQDAVNQTRTNQVSLLKVLVDIKNQTYTAWLVTRGDRNTPYTEKQPQRADLLVENEPLNGNLKEITGIEVYSQNTYADQTHITKLSLEPLSDEKTVENAFNSLEMKEILGENISADDVKTNLDLPVAYQNTEILWSVSPEGIIGNDGKLIKLPDETTTITLKADITRGSVSKSKEFKVTVKKPIPEVIILSVENGVLKSEIKNITDGTLICAAYKNDTLSAMEVVDIKAITNGNYDFKNMNVKPEDGITSYKLMAWTGIDNMKPICINAQYNMINK